ncbi:MAG: hypothetical protein MHM6MM_004848 [Cercozoa sp. M6MM]
MPKSAWRRMMAKMTQQPPVPKRRFHYAGMSHITGATIGLFATLALALGAVLLKASNPLQRAERAGFIHDYVGDEVPEEAESTGSRSRGRSRTVTASSADTENHDAAPE